MDFGFVCGSYASQNVQACWWAGGKCYHRAWVTHTIPKGAAW